MGLRTASVRRPNVEVMAPALTDTAQTQNFNLPSKNRLEPVSPINSFETSKYLPTTAKKCIEPVSPLNTDDLSNTLKNLNPLDLCPKKPFLESYLKSSNGASDNILTQTMSLDPLPMANREEKMGLQKAGLNVNNVNKVKSTSDVDQLFNSSLEANVDDIMQQVIKSIESDDQLNNSSSDLNEVLDLNIDKELLEHVDNMINISIDDQQDDLETAQKIKENQATVILSDLQRKHWRVERRLDFLRRRCYKLEAKLIGQNISGEIYGVFEQVHRSLKKPKETNESTKPFGATSSFEITEKLKPLSVSSAKVLAKKLEMAKILQSNLSSRQKNVPKYFGSGSIESIFRNSANGQVNIPQWSIDNKQELQKVTGQLHSQLHLVQDALDSEATESSSGGESCDEFQTYNNPHQQYLSIQKRALWKYSTDRAAIASRWTWVQSQISDLEYRIRQHTEIHKQIRAKKGAVQLGDVPMRKQPLQSQSEIDGHHDYSALPLESTSAVNGYLGQLPGAPTGKTSESELTDCHQCARTRPLINFRKRKLLQVAGLHAVSKKAARPSTIRCNCVPSMPPCALCTGRIDPTHPRDPPDTLGKSEKVSLLDPGFHPVLSLPEDTSQTLHLEAIMKMYEWQQRSLKMKTMKVLHKPDRMEQRALERRTKKLEHRKKYGRLKASTASALSEKIKKKLRGRKVGRPPGSTKKRQSQPTISHHLQNLDATSGAVSEDGEVEAALESGFQTPVSGAHSRGVSFDSPGGSPLLHMQSISGYRQHNRNSRVDSYDIDNIVIPYSVAAATRVEKLQYKEILTPKWRIADTEAELIPELECKNNGDLGEDSDVEDLSEESVVARHDRCEHDEKKRFLSYLKLPPGYGGNRQRSHKRHDSLVESSGANTPDPASPHPDTGAKAGNDGSLLGSPPSTPGMGLEESNLPSVALMRRRTVSQSRFREIRDEGPPVDYVEQPPYDARTFPLVESDYDHMVEEMPDANREVKTNYRAQDTGDDIPTKQEADSPDSESTESALGEDTIMDEEDETMMDEDEEEEDPNDPEWTDAEKSSHRERHYRR